MSWYVTIRSDAGYSRFAATAPLVEFLAGMPELRPTGPAVFGAAADQPWVVVIVGACDPSGCYASDGTAPPAVNMVELICSDVADPGWYERVSGRIAEFLGWSAFDDHEGRQVWPPLAPG
ncbi:hypothetical protein J0H58_32450 [bacterium]|nr:hypothetical protein [bacterium]